MPSYQFENRAGYRRTIVAPMKDSPPEVVRFDDDGKHIACDREHPDAFIRVYETGHAYARNWSAWRSPMTGGKMMEI